MKNLIITFSLILLNSLLCFSQNLVSAPNDKAVVYFARTSSLGALINFSYFDSAKYIGKHSGTGYVRYECEAGKHLFWARSENRDFIEADLEVGKVYFLEVIPRMGAIKAAVELYAVDPKNPKEMKKIIKLLDKKPAESFTNEELALQEKLIPDVIARGLERYNTDKAKGVSFQQLEKSMYYSAQ